MRILWTFCVYNEIEMLPFKIDFIAKNKIDYHVFDNMSTDGSWEWLQRNGIPSERFDSDGMFDLRSNLALIIKKIHEVKPDWAIFAGADDFYVHLKCKSLREAIERADRESFTVINDKFRLFDFHFTGTENPGADPKLTYYFYNKKSQENACFIAKYFPDTNITADRLKNNEERVLKDRDLIFLHYGLRHDWKDRKKEQFLRRKKAWDANKIPKDWGRHYKGLAERSELVFDKNYLLDVRNSEVWERIKDSL